MHGSDPILKAFEYQKDAILLQAHLFLEETFPDLCLMQTDSHFFHPQIVEKGWTFSRSMREETWSIFETEFNNSEKSSYKSPVQGWFEAEWNGNRFLLMAISLKGEHCIERTWFVAGESEAANKGFFEAVCRAHSSTEGKVLVFSSGQWYLDEELFEAISNSRLDDLVLHGDLKKELVDDLRLFMEQVEVFDKYRIPWKRGMLLLGPPGNGKTHFIRAIGNHMQLPCLYVRSFASPYVPPQHCVGAVFERAREEAPCFVIFEDLDTLLTDETRSFFLNEMDGFASNRGIITIATCNFPEKLDSAITDRPSRFDRKYHFLLPVLEDRQRYLLEFGERFEGELRLSDSDAFEVAKTTEGFSYAYLKELYVSSAVRWMSSDSSRRLSDIMSDQTATLLEQMRSSWNDSPPGKGADAWSAEQFN